MKKAVIALMMSVVMNIIATTDRSLLLKREGIVMTIVGFLIAWSVSLLTDDDYKHQRVAKKNPTRFMART